MRTTFCGILLLLSVGWSTNAPTDDVSITADIVSAVDEINQILESKVATNSKNATQAGNSTDEDAWLGQCEDLSHDLQRGWNLTCRIFNRSVDVFEKFGSAAYGLINCKETTLGVPVVPIKCIWTQLEALKNIINPAVKEGYNFTKEALGMVPGTWKDWKKCLSLNLS